MSRGQLKPMQIFGILPRPAKAGCSNYMRHKELGSDPILTAMPGPWGRAVAHLRIERRLSQRVVAKRAKMTATTYGRIERGQHTQTRKLQDIADVFGVPIEQVLQHLSLQSETVTGNTALTSREAQHEQRRPVHTSDPAAALFHPENLKLFARELGKEFRKATDAAEVDRASKVEPPHKPASSRSPPASRKRRSR